MINTIKFTIICSFVFSSLLGMEKENQNNSENNRRHLPTTLHEAVKRNNQKEINKFIGLEKADINGTREGALPLGLAVSHGHYDLIDHLVNNQAEINQKDSEGKTCLHWAMLVKDKYLKNASIDRKAMIKTLLEHGANPSIKNDLNDTALHLAALLGHDKAVKTLLKHSATQSNVKNNRGDTPMHLAASKGHLNIVKILYKHELDHAVNDTSILLKNNLGNLPFHCAALNNHIDCVRFFLSLEILDVSLPNENDQTALHLALLHKNTVLAHYLIEHGININHLDYRNENALFYAVSNDLYAIAKLLLDHHINVNQKNDNGKTPLDIAYSKYNKELQALLKAGGAKKGLPRARGARKGFYPQ